MGKKTSHLFHPPPPRAAKLPPAMPLTITIDVEDWAQSTLDPELPITDRAEANTHHVLDLLARHSQKATCFVLGKFAEKFPACVNRIAADGHEIASHGYGHVNVFQQSPEEFRQDIRKSKRQLEDLTGKSVFGYRAPAFSITKDALWAPEIIAEEGFLYDSSINPAVAVRNGIASWPSSTIQLTFESGKTLVEFPMATVPVLGKQLPVAGGGYHRLLPRVVISRIVSSCLKKGDHFVAYCHPYEFDPDEFKNSPFEVDLKTRLHQGIGRKGFEGKFLDILKKHRSERLADFLQTSSFTNFSFSQLTSI